MIPVARPWMGEDEVAAARRAVLSGWVTQGPEVAAFEREFAVAVGATHACAVSNCTAALHLALVGLDVGPGDEVVTVSHSFIATANAVRHCGATPVFVDVDLATFNMDPALVEGAITPRTKAILCVHQVGMPCDVRVIVAIARAHGLKVVEDAACAVGSRIASAPGGSPENRWEQVGRPHGDVACFSFHPRKLISTGDGGMLTTADAAFDQRVRLLRQQGMSVSDTARYASARVINEAYPVVGFNYRLTDIQGAIGREQLKRLPAIVARRRLLADRYRAGLTGVLGVLLPVEPSWAQSNWQSYVVRVESASRQYSVMQRLLDNGIATRRGVMNSHREAAYPHGSWTMASGGLSRGEWAQDTGIVLPLYHQLTEGEQDRVIAALIDAVSA